MNVLNLEAMKSISGAGGQDGTNIVIYNQANASASANNGSGSKSKKGS